MTFAELTQTKGWKNFMAKLYGLGAAIVIVGALFKIMHWPGAGPMLVVGLITEAIIFIFSAFEPLHEELDWTLAYPELVGIDDDGHGHGGHGGTKKPVGTSVSLIDEKILEGADNAPELFAKLRKGLENLGNTASNMADISNVTAATNGYAESLNTASQSVNDLNGTYKESADTFKQSTEGLNYAVDGLSDSYNKSAEKVAASTSDLANSYNALSDSMKIDIDFSAVTDGNKSYGDSIVALNKNLSALNALFELQLQGGVDEMLNDISEGVQESHKYREEVTKLRERLQALNGVYGKMLSAMNVPV